MAEVELRDGQLGEKMVIVCPGCGKEYAPNAGRVSRCPICYEVFPVSFEEVGIKLALDEKRWERLLRRVAMSPIKLIRCDGGPRIGKKKNGGKNESLQN